MTPDQERLVAAMMQEQQAPQPAPPQQSGGLGRNLAAAGELGLMALPITRLGRAMMSTLPRALGTSAGVGTVIEGARGNLPGLGGLISGAQAAEPVPPDASELKEPEVKAFQAKMKAQNRYTGPIDGTINPGGPTHRLWEEERASIMSRNQSELAATSQRAAAEAAKAQADAKAAEAQGDLAKAQAARARAEQAKTEADAAEARRRQAEISGKKLDEFRSSPGGIAAQVGLTIGPYLGAGLGYWAGHALQGGIGARAESAALARANRADAVMRSTSPKGTAGDISRVNRFFTEGGGQEPFNFVPNAPARAIAPYKINPVQTSPGQLYNPSSASSIMEGAALPIAGLAEHILTEYTMNRPAKERLQAALDAANKDPNDVNIQNLQNAMVAAGFGQLFSRLGLGMMAGSFAQTMTHRVVGGDPRARPAQLQRAESERARLQNILAQPLPPKGAAGPPQIPLQALPPPRVSPGQAQPLGVPPLANTPKALPAPRPKKKGKS